MPTQKHNDSFIRLLIGKLGHGIHIKNEYLYIFPKKAKWPRSSPLHANNNKLKIKSNRPAKNK